MEMSQISTFDRYGNGVLKLRRASARLLSLKSCRYEAHQEK